MTDEVTPPLTERDSYTHWSRMTIRFGDEDSMGHVNNAVYATWFEAPRVLLLDEFVRGHDDLNTVLARLTVDYLRETTFPGEVDVGGRLLSLGNRSLATGFAAFRDGVCLATCVSVNVFFDTRSRKSCDAPADVRAAIEAALQAGSPDG